MFIVITSTKSVLTFLFYKLLFPIILLVKDLKSLKVTNNRNHNKQNKLNEKQKK